MNSTEDAGADERFVSGAALSAKEGNRSCDLGGAQGSL